MRIPALLLFVVCILPLSAGAQDDPALADRIYIVTDYRYVAEGQKEASDIGQSLCGTRCNTLSADYLNYLEPGGWRLIKVTSNKELNIDLSNPFKTGKCICTADEYIAIIDNLNKPR